MKQETNSASEVVYASVHSFWDDSVKLFIPATAMTSNRCYSAGELYKTITKNENWKVSDLKNNTKEEFKDKQGKLILARRFESGEKFDTFYIYDQYGNLSFVLPPLVDPALSVSSTILDGLCYQYKYDYRNRLSEKKLPGKQWDFMVYNKLDQLVMTGPVVSPFVPTENGWMFNKYDGFGRVCYTC